MPAAQPTRRRLAAVELLARCTEWEPFIGPTGVRFFRIKGSKGAVYTVNSRSCTCPDRQTRSSGRQAACKHMRAVAMYSTVAKAFGRHVAALNATAQQEEPHERQRPASRTA